MNGVPCTTCAGASICVPECITVVMRCVKHAGLGHAVQPLDLDVLEIRPAGLPEAPRVAQIVELQPHLVEQIRFLELAKAFVAPIAVLPAGHARTPYVAYRGAGVLGYGMTVDVAESTGGRPRRIALRSRPPRRWAPFSIIMGAGAWAATDTGGRIR